jgi:acetolactate synthase-1/2/3 large subunit
LARFEAQGSAAPRVIVCPHENVAVHMAGGYAAMTGRGQGVLVHVDAGTANAAMGLHNLLRSRLPVMLMAGRAPFTLRGELTGSRDTYVHFIQDPFDMPGLVRPYTKWEYCLPSGVITKEVIARGHTVMQSDPQGPVFLALPREVLAETWPADQVRSFPPQRYGAVSADGASPETVRHIAESLLQAEHPVVFTSYLGRKAEAVQALEALAMACGIRVVEFNPNAMSISRQSICFAGFDPTQQVPLADLGLLLDVDVPWIPKSVTPSEHTRWLHVDVDTVKKDLPMWGFATDLRVQADCATVLGQVLASVQSLATDEQRGRIRQRLEVMTREHAQRQARLHQAAEVPGEDGALNPAFVCATLSHMIDAQDVVVNEGIRNVLAVLQHIERTEPLTLLGGAGGGLGYSGGMALGVKLASPERRVIQLVGDGGFHFSTPTSVYAVAQAEGLPILTVVLDNGGWQAVKDAVLRVHPGGQAAKQNEFHARLRGQHRHFHQVGQAFGAHGEHVHRPQDLEAAVQRCLQALDRGQAAVLVVSVAPL